MLICQTFGGYRIWGPFGGGGSSWLTSENLPKKHLADQCPQGFRIPTATEFQKLINNTIASNIGTWAEGSYSAAIVLTSKTDKNVKLTFPIQGLMMPKKVANLRTFPPNSVDESFPYGEVAFRGTVIYLHTSTVEFIDENYSNFFISVVQMSEDVVAATNNTCPKNIYSQNNGKIIRCIAE